MGRVRVKIEGLRDAATACQVAAMGADAIGLVFAPSPRRATSDAAREIVRALPPWIATVGVFVNASADEINEVVRTSHIGYVQLHGDESPDIIADIDARCLKAFRVRDGQSLIDAADWVRQARPAGNLAGVVLDAFSPSAYGGTGERFNWDLIAQARASGQIRDLGPMILAGGLDSQCVREAVATVQPWGVDVASGVESSPGVKDLAKVRAFIEAVAGTVV